MSTPTSTSTGETVSQAAAERDGPVRRPLIKRYLPKSLLGRALMIIGVPLVVVQVIATWVFYDRHYDHVTKRLAQGLAGDIAMVIQVMGNDPVAAERSGALERARNALWLTAISWRDGETIALSGQSPSGGLLDRKLHAALDERLRYAFRVDTDAADEQVLIEVQLGDRVLQVQIPHDRLFSSTEYIFIIWMVGSSIILFSLATLFMRNQVKPIRRLATAAESFGKGHDVPDFKPEGAIEVRQAAAAFLQMRDRIRRSIAQRTEMLAGVSHDLRTPLTRMKLELALLGEQPEVENLSTDLQEMERMVEGYLAFARGEGVEQPEVTDLAGLLYEVVAQMRRDGSPIDLHIAQELELPIRRESLRRCLTNLIANAQRHGDLVSIRASRGDHQIEVLIDDDGPGIPPESREEVFRPFFRLDDSRNPETGGTGLGLSIARDAVRSHGGDLVLEDAPSGGLRARLWLPV